MISDVDVARIKKYQRLWQFGMESADVQKYKWTDRGCTSAITKHAEGYR